MSLGVDDLRTSLDINVVSAVAAVQAVLGMSCEELDDAFEF